jgi:hypothetical protein
VPVTDIPYRGPMCLGAPSADAAPVTERRRWSDASDPQELAALPVRQRHARHVPVGHRCEVQESLSTGSRQVERSRTMTKIKHMAYSIAMLATLALALGAPFKNN